MHGSFGLPELPSKRHIDRFSRFCKAHLCDQQTYTQTDTLRVTSVASMLCKRRGLYVVGL